MNTLLLVACIGMITGFFIVLKLSPTEFSELLFSRFRHKPHSIKDNVNEVTKRKKHSWFHRELEEIQTILKLTGRENKFSITCLSSLLLFAVGASVAILMNNPFLLPVLAVGFALIPFWYVRLTQNYYKKAISAELETALSIITTAYLRTEDIQTAVEENISYLNPPMVGVFREFLFRIKMINPDIDSALLDMKDKIKNEVFEEWVEAVVSCQYDRSLKSTLTPIVSKLSDMRIVNGELDNMVFEPRKEFIIMAVLVIGNIPLMYFLNKSWYETLMHTPMGQIILAICTTAIFISTAFVIKLTQPIEYRR